MAIVKTHLFNISFEHCDLLKMLIKIDQLSDRLYLQESKKIAGNVKGVSIMEDNPYNNAFEKISGLLDYLKIEKETVTQYCDGLDIKQTEEYLDSLNQKVFEIKEIKEEIINDSEENKEAIMLLKNIDASVLNIDDLNNSQYITCRFGKIPIPQIIKLDYYNQATYIFEELSRDDHYVWGMYYSLNTHIIEIDNIFSSMEFEEVMLPNFIHGTMKEALDEVSEEYEAMIKYIARMDEHLEEVKITNKDKLLNTYTKLNNLKRLYDKCIYMIDFNHKVAFYAFSCFSLDEISEELKDISSVKILELPTTMYVSKDIISPVIVKNNEIVKPFEKILKNKNGDRIDTTSAFALTTLIASALLIGDLGVGLTLCLIGFLSRKKLMGALLLRIGVAVFVGGLLDGTFFYGTRLYGPIFTISISLQNAYADWVIALVVLAIVLTIFKWILRKRNKT